MRLTEFWRRMSEVFGPHADSLASDHVFSELGNRTIREALGNGEPTKEVWRAVCTAMDVAPSKR